MQPSKTIAGVVTFLICSFLLIWMLVARLSWNPRVFSTEPDPYIAMAEIPEEEFIEVEVVPLPGGGDEVAAAAKAEIENEAQPAPQTGTSLNTQGRVDKPAQTVTSPKPSPVKETQKPTPAKPAASVENKREQEEKAAAKQTNQSVKNAFANANNKNNAMNGANDSGVSGRQDGDNSSAAGSAPNGLRATSSYGTVGAGWMLPAYSKNIPSNEVGSVTFEVEVMQDGSVGKITQISNKGLTSPTIARCRTEIQKHKFRHTDPEKARPTTARITFTFQDPK